MFLALLGVDHGLLRYIRKVEARRLQEQLDD